MKRIGILTAGGDTPALNATVHGAVVQANRRRVEVYGFIKGYSALLNPAVPYVHLNPLFTEIPELDPTRGGTVIGASRAFVDPEDTETIAQIADRLKQLKIDGLICVGGDGTLNGLQPFAELFPVVLAPKTIDNDLGLNHPNEPDEWERAPTAGAPRLPLPARPLADPLRARRDGQLRHPGLRHRGLRLGAGPPARAHDRREPPPHRDRRGDGPPLGLHRARHRVRPARHHPHPRGPGAHPRPRRARARALRAAEERGHRLRGGHRRRGRPRARRRSARPTTPRATSPSPAPRTRSAASSIDHFGDALLPAVPAGRVGEGGGLHPEGRAHAARRTAHPLRPLPRRRARGQGGRHAPRGTEQRDRHPAVEPRRGASTSTPTTATPSATAGASSTPATCTRASTTRS